MTYIEQMFQKPCYAKASEIAQTLRTYTRICFSSHTNPDADALGSMGALAHGLKSLGKEVLLCNTSGLPGYLNWLPLTGKVHKQLFGTGFKPELVVILDCGDADRLGNLKTPLLKYPSINIDHHMNNPQFGSVANWTDHTMAATGLMVAAILHNLNIPLKGDIATSLYASISSDTGSYSFDNTSEDALLLTSYLVQEGLKVAEVRQNMDNQWSLERMRLWGTLTENLQLGRKGSIAIVTIPQSMLKKYNTTKEDLEGFVEHLRKLRGVVISGIIREDAKEQCKISLRSTGAIDVRSICAQFGGGGHLNAAGATLHHNLTKSHELLFLEVQRYLDEYQA